MGLKGHRLDLGYRKSGQFHTYLPSCTCSWTGIATARRATAEAEYRAHIRQQENEAHASRRKRRTPGPRRPTPNAALPNELRHAV